MVIIIILMLLSSWFAGGLKPLLRLNSDRKHHEFLTFDTATTTTSF